MNGDTLVTECILLLTTNSAIANHSGQFLVYTFGLPVHLWIK